MPRSARKTPGGLVYHVLNRGVGRGRIFSKPEDYEAFERVVEETLERRPMRICGYCLMPNHWHFVLWPESDDDLARFMQRLTITHVTRWQKHKRRVGYGHLYQGRYKSFPVESDGHFYQVLRYVERNALRANLVQQADAWKWSSLWRYYHGNREQKKLLSKWPIPRSRNWQERVQTALTDSELEAIHRSVIRGRPFGSDEWTDSTAKMLGLQFTMRRRGRPTKPRG